MVMSNLHFRLMGYHTKIEKYNNIKCYLFYLGIASLFFNLCICIGADNTNTNDTISQIIYLIIFTVIQCGALVADIYLTKKNWLYEYEIFRIESEDLERKKSVAAIKGEILPEYILNKEIKAPESIHFNVRKYVILLVINIVVIIIWFFKVKM